MKMHADQVDLTPETVAALVAAQFPDWAGLPVMPVDSPGTVNALFRLGAEVVLRFPLRPSRDTTLRDELATEQDRARRVARQVPVAVPEPLGLGRPGDGYDGWWTAYRWIDGATAYDAGIGDGHAFARDLAGFVRGLWAMDTGDETWNATSRGGILAANAEEVAEALSASTGLIDTAAIEALWHRCLAAPGPEAARWIHADLMPGNLVVREGGLAAVIDLEMLRVADPAVDLMPAWNLFDASARRTYRQALDVDDATWDRGRGWAIVQAVVALPYYVDTNPVMAGTARRTLGALLEHSGQE